MMETETYLIWFSQFRGKKSKCYFEGTSGIICCHINNIQRNIFFSFQKRSWRIHRNIEKIFNRQRYSTRLRPQQVQLRDWPRPLLKPLPKPHPLKTYYLPTVIFLFEF